MSKLTITDQQLAHTFPDSISWAGFWITLISLAVSVVGLIATWRQAKAAKTASVAAGEAAAEAFTRMRQRELTVSLSSVSLQVHLIKEYLNSGNITGARIYLQQCIRDLRNIFVNFDINALALDGRGDVSIDILFKELTDNLDQPTINHKQKIAVIRTLSSLSESIQSEEAKRRWAEK